jgi:peptide/nickel transport system substrate-binding protein
LALIASSVSYCGIVTFAKVTPAHADEEKVLRIVQETELQSLNQNVQSTRGAMRVAAEIQEGPVKIVMKDGLATLTPGLATEWQQIDETTWRFKIRQGVKFSNGEDLTSEAFVRTLAFWREYPIGKNVADFSNIEIEAVDEYTFDVKTATPNLSSLPAQMSYFVVYPPKYRASLGTGEAGEVGFGNAPIGTGPYMVDEWRRGVSLRLKANPNYWGEPPAVKAVEIKSVPDGATRVSMLQSGAVDIAAEVPAPLYSRIEAISGSRLITVPSNVRIFLALNLNTKPTDNQKVRQAINYAINRDGIVKGLLKGAGERINGLFLPGELGYDENFKGYPYDPEMARKLLAESGLPTPIPLTLNYTIGLWDVDKQLAEAIQAQLQEVGFDVSMKGGPSSSVQVNWRKPGASDGIYQFQFGPVYPDSNFLMNLVYFAPKSVYHAFGTDEHLTELATKGGSAPSEERNAIYQEAQRYAIDDLAIWAPLYVRQLAYGVSDEVDWQPPSNNWLYLSTAKWKQDGQ